MFSRHVRIENHSIWVTCTPSMPLSDVLRRAAHEMNKIEIEADERDPVLRAYKMAAALAHSE